MANKNITTRELNNNGTYVPTYLKTLATQTVLSEKTKALFGNSVTNADEAFKKIVDTLSKQALITIKVVDEKGNPLEGVSVGGLLLAPSTNANGTVTGVFLSDPLNFTSPYLDILDGTANGASYAGTTNILTVTLQSIENNKIFRYTKSDIVKFSGNVDSIDVCCVAGGGGGGGCDKVMSYTQTSGGGGGGGIVNSMGMTVTPNRAYSFIVGSGGFAGEIKSQSYHDYETVGGDGGATIFYGTTTITANGGKGGHYIHGSYAGGVAGATGCGQGGFGGDGRKTPTTAKGANGTSNTTISEFNDGVTFYSGGGGAAGAIGGLPNGADGAQYRKQATTAKTGGGGGGAYKYADQTVLISNEYPASAGGAGLVSIRVHLK